MRHLVIVGSGGLARETVELVRAINAVGATWKLLGYLDDDPQKHGRRFAEFAVLGGTEALRDMGDAMVVLCVGSSRDNGSRRRLVERLQIPPERYATLVHPRATLADSVSVGPGCIVLGGAVATADVRIGAHVVVMPSAVFTHDDVIEDYVTVAAGALLAGGVLVGEAAYIGTGASVRENVIIGAGATVGMGAVVLSDVPPGEVWAGVPAAHIGGV